MAMPSHPASAIAWCNANGKPPSVSFLSQYSSSKRAHSRATAARISSCSAVSAKDISTSRVAPLRLQESASSGPFPRVKLARAYPPLATTLGLPRDCLQRQAGKQGSRDCEDQRCAQTEHCSHRPADDRADQRRGLIGADQTGGGAGNHLIRRYRLEEAARGHDEDRHRTIGDELVGDEHCASVGSTPLRHRYQREADTGEGHDEYHRTGQAQPLSHFPRLDRCKKQTAPADGGHHAERAGREAERVHDEQQIDGPEHAIAGRPSGVLAVNIRRRQSRAMKRTPTAMSSKSRAGAGARGECSGFDMPQIASAEPRKSPRRSPPRGVRSGIARANRQRESRPSPRQPPMQRGDYSRRQSLPCRRGSAGKRHTRRETGRRARGLCEPNDIELRHRQCSPSAASGIDSRMTARPTSDTIIDGRRSRLSVNTPGTRLITRPENTTVAENSPISNGVAERTMTAANLIAD